MDTEYREAGTVRAMFEAAISFGLSQEEVWRTFNGCLLCSDDDVTVPEYLDEVAGALARSILAKQRQSSREQLS